MAVEARAGGAVGSGLSAGGVISEYDGGSVYRLFLAHQVLLVTDETSDFPLTGKILVIVRRRRWRWS